MRRSSLSLRPPLFAGVAALAAFLAATATAAQTSSYVHSSGIGFDYPEGWQVRETPQGILVLPADVSRDPATGQPTEMVILGSQTAPQIQTVSDPQVTQFFDQLLAGGMRRTGEPASLSTGVGPGLVLTYEGAPSGQLLRQKVYVTLFNGEAVYLTHLAVAERFQAREAQAREIFTSLSRREAAGAAPGVSAGPDQPPPSATDGSRDPDLVGRWSRSSNEGSSGVGGYVGSETREVLEFAADGRMAYSSSTSIFGGSPGVSILGQGDPDAIQGTWTASNGQIVVTWADGSREVFGYRVFIHEGRPALRIDMPGGERRYFTR